MEEIRPSSESPVRGEGEAIEIIEFRESTIVLRALKSGRVYGVDLNSPGTEQEELSVTELESAPEGNLSQDQVIEHHWV
jgi:hypothetical protein